MFFFTHCYNLFPELIHLQDSLLSKNGACFYELINEYSFNNVGVFSHTYKFMCMSIIRVSCRNLLIYFLGLNTTSSTWFFLKFKINTHPVYAQFYATNRTNYEEVIRVLSRDASASFAVGSSWMLHVRLDGSTIVTLRI